MNSPFDIMRTRLNLGLSSVVSENSLFSLVKYIWRNEGIRGFYIGFTGNLIGIPIFQTINLTSYYYLKNYFYKNHGNGKEKLIYPFNQKTKKKKYGMISHPP
jgi:hypothetical protein